MKIPVRTVRLVPMLLSTIVLGAWLQDRPERPEPPRPAPEQRHPQPDVTEGGPTKVQPGESLHDLIRKRARIRPPAKPPCPPDPCEYEIRREENGERYYRQVHSFLEDLNKALLVDIGITLRLFSGLDEQTILADLDSIRERQARLSIFDQVTAREALLNELLTIAAEEG